MSINSEKKTAIPFIILNKNKTFEITKEAEIYLSSLEGKKLGIVSIAGKYRTGKSYFLNKLIQNKRDKNGFEVGPTINSCTKGIWIWPETFKSENSDEDDLEVLVLDTEGFGGINENQNHDTRIFIFSLLLSSMFIYNSVGSIDENALQTLSLIVNLAKNIQLGETKLQPNQSKIASDSIVSEISNDISHNISQKTVNPLMDLTEESLLENFPHFLWIIRDFCLELKDSFGNPITSKVYFENSLKNVNNLNASADGKNKIRSMIKHFFRNRDCITMVRPVEKEIDLQNLDNLEDTQLRPEFVQQIKKTRKMILMKTVPKKIKGTTLDGLKFFQLATAYVNSINSGSAPNIDSAWNYIVQFENEKKLRTIYSKLKLSKSCIKNKDDINSMIESVFVDFEHEKIGTCEEAEEVKRKIETEIRRELETDCNRFTETVKKSIGEKVEECLDSLKKQILEMDKFELNAIDNMVETKIDQIVDKFKEQLTKEEIKNISGKFFAKGKSDLFQLSFKQLEKIKARETKELENCRLDAEKKFNDINERLKLQNEQILKQTESENIRINEVLKEKQKVIWQNEQLKGEKEKIALKLKNMETEFLKLETEFMCTKSDEVGQHLKTIEEISEKLQESESNRQKESVLLNGKIKYLESNLQKTKSDLMQKEQELTSKVKEFESKAILIEELENKLKNQKPVIPETHILLEKTKFSEMREKLANFDDLKENYEKIIREVLEERNMVQNQFEFLKENFELEKNKNFKLLKDIHARVSSKKEHELPVPNTNNLLSENAEKENSHCAYCVQKVGFKTAEFGQKALENINGDKLGENLEIIVTGTVILRTEEPDDDKTPEFQKTSVMYCVDVKNDKKTWSIQKRFRDFFDLSIKLQRTLKKIELPPSCKELWNFVKDIWGTVGSKSFPLENRKIIIEKMMRDLAKIRIIRSSSVFIEFLNEEPFRD